MMLKITCVKLCGADSFKIPKCDRNFQQFAVIIRNMMQTNIVNDTKSNIATFLLTQEIYMLQLQNYPNLNHCNKLSPKRHHTSLVALQILTLLSYDQAGLKLH